MSTTPANRWAGRSREPVSVRSGRAHGHRGRCSILARCPRAGLQAAGTLASLPLWWEQEGLVSQAFSGGATPLCSNRGILVEL